MSARHEDFVYIAEGGGRFIHLPTMTPRSARVVDSMIPETEWHHGSKPSAYIKRIEHGLLAESMVWVPGGPRLIPDVIVTDEGLQQHPGARALNTYVAPPRPNLALAPLAQPWVDFVKRFVPDRVEREYFLDHCAHAVQCPGDPCNTAIVLSGASDIESSTMLAPVQVAVGEWNVLDIEAKALRRRRCDGGCVVMLAVHGEWPTTRTIYAALVGYATTRWTLPLRVFVTTDGLNEGDVPPSDPYMLILKAKLLPGDQLLQWLATGGGNAAVAAWLAARDLSAFNGHAAPPRGGRRS